MQTMVRFVQSGEPVFDRLAEVRAPTVIMVGDKDRASLIAANEEAARRIPGGRLIMMAGVDHFPTVREPRSIVETILGQLAAAG